jgi:hypothetical protein
MELSNTPSVFHRYRTIILALRARGSDILDSLYLKGSENGGFVKIKIFITTMLLMSAATLQAATTADQFQSSGTILSAMATGSGFRYNLFASETTTRGKNGISLVYVGATVCNGQPDQPFTCLTVFGWVDGRLLSRQGNAATLNIPDAAAAGLYVTACNEFTCFPVTSTPFPIQVTLRANGLYAHEFDGTQRQTYNFGGQTTRYYSKGQSNNQSASVQGRIGYLTLPVLGVEFEYALLSDSKNTLHLIQRETKP